MIKKRILQLKKLIINYNLDGYIIPKNDAYFSEFSRPDRLKQSQISLDQLDLQ